MISLSCENQNLPPSMTVGTVFQSRCTGELEGLNPEQVKLENLKDKYQIKLLKVEKNEEAAVFYFTSYRVGSHQLEKIQISSGESSFEIPGFSFQVTSVLPPPTQGEGQMTEPPKPFGPVGPLAIQVPFAYWLILISVVGMGLMVAALKWKRRKDRKNIFLEIKKRTTGPTPVVQFHRDLRILTRKAGVQAHGEGMAVDKQEYLTELRQIIETFLGQKFNLALLNQEPENFEKEFKSQAPKIYVKYKDELKFWNNRWKKLYSGSKQAHMQDFVEMTVSTRDLVEKIAEEQL